MTESEDMTPATSEESVAVPDPSGRRAKRHAAYNVMVKRAIISLKSKKGSSRKAIIRYICAHNSVKKTHCIRAVGRAIKRMLRSGMLYRNKRGSFKLTGKGRGLKARKRRRRRASKKAGRRRRKKRGRKGKKSKKSKKGKKKKSKKSKKGKKKKGRKGKRGKKSRRRVRRRKSPKRANRRRKGAKRRKSKKGKKRGGKRKR